MSRNAALDATGRWLGVGFWAILDQGFFAGANFVLNVLLARWMQPEQYGSFAVSFSAFLLLSTVHTALVTEPLLIFGGSRFHDTLALYFGRVRSLHWRLSAVLGGTMVLGGLIVRLAGEELMSVSLVACGCALPLMLFQWMMRRSCYVELRPREAVVGGAVYALLVVGGAVSLHLLSALSSGNAFVLMGLASFCSGLWILRNWNNSAVIDAGRQVSLLAVIRQHWAYGRWAVGAAALTWVPLNIFYFLLPIRGGLEATAGFRALHNLLLPIIHVNQGLNPVLVTAFVRVRESRLFGARVRKAAVAAAALGFAYWALIGGCHRAVVAGLYGGRYDGQAPMLRWLGVVSIFVGLSVVAECALRALERPDRIFWSSSIAGATALVSGGALVPVFGVHGAALGLVASTFAGALTMNLLLRAEIASSEGARFQRSGTT